MQAKGCVVQMLVFLAMAYVEMLVASPAARRPD
jgi:hypothetical protein